MQNLLCGCSEMIMAVENSLSCAQTQILVFNLLQDRTDPTLFCPQLCTVDLVAGHHILPKIDRDASYLTNFVVY
jgi:hypothetical protein